MQAADIATPARGAYASLEELIALRFPARQLQLARRNRALSALTGPNKSNFRGRGIDFEEVRSYQAGDDIRSIDWRVTARTGEAHTKLFREERERQVLISVDQRNGMFFGSSHCCKSVLAAHLASLLCWAALQRGDRVGGLVFSDQVHKDIRPRRSRRSVLGLLNAISDLNAALPADSAGSSGDFAEMLVDLRRVARPGSSLFIVSDFAGALEAGALEHIYQLGRHLEITAIHCADPLERSLPTAGRYSVTDGQRRADLFTGDTTLKRAFSERYHQQLETLRQQYGKLGIPLITASTGDSPLDLLQRYYAENAGARR